MMTLGLRCPSGGIGRRARLKIVFRKGCGFNSHLGHIKYFSPDAKHSDFSILVFRWELKDGDAKPL